MVGRDTIYDINELRQDGLSTDRYFAELVNNGDGTPSFANAFTDGVDPSQIQSGAMVSDLKSPNYVETVSGWVIRSDGSVEFNSGDFRGNVTVGSIDIGGDDATSAHIDTDGNLWLGASVANKATAPARISNAGAAHFENVEIGGSTIQYVITNSGIFSFGDASDGDATFADQGTAPTGTTKTDNTAGATVYRMDRDVYYDSATVNATVTLAPNGYRLFVKNLLTVNGSIVRNGTSGGNGGNAPGTGNEGGAAGSSGGGLSDGYLKGEPSPGAGGRGGGGGGTNGAAGTAGGSVSNGLNSAANGAAGGAGGDDTIPGGGFAGGGGGTTTAANVKLIANWHLATLLDVSSTGSTVKFTNSASAGGGGGGGAGAQLDRDGGGGGGGGGNGGILAIYARSIVVGAAGSITANAGNGGNGGNGNSANSGGGGGGGGGGNGGIIILTYNSLTNSGSITVTAGTGGTGGTGAGGGINGTAGTNGSAGLIYQFQLSL